MQAKLNWMFKGQKEKLFESNEVSTNLHIEERFHRRSNSFSTASPAASFEERVSSRMKALSKTSSATALALLDTLTNSPLAEIDANSLENLCKAVLQPVHSLNESANELMTERSARVRDIALPTWTRVRYLLYCIHCTTKKRMSLRLRLSKGITTTCEWQECRSTVLVKSVLS